ncbi:phenylalanine--tRNA ligase subunit alpha [Agrococcus sediminis]|uniref:Phenylalanine--tRNA ligase alpha subunit n=1 Tax=Agrococcus sediminis TaxID=2599924 RepID=A0A5M8QTC3_9MICO|nr:MULTISPECIES: phenylalanine--tRNA ligase subunit alpha [Agrococcus]KAA6437876.1 phenylalanine--tRNA ligase subunit alpha [Agrococcus sediminis]RWR21875.1 phenylalanine--tRNA ligase subunit alpha [Agrococcus lahaulensis]UOW00143.1 phenylalanine--tRNA ligase subunit alpha [Agrococcus sp. SCSIO52902]
MPTPDENADLGARVDAAVAAALAAIEAAQTTADLQAAKAAHNGQGSELAGLNASLRDIAPEQRKAAGQTIGAGRGRVAEAIAARQQELAAAEEAAQLEAERVDVTALPRIRTAGGRHPLTMLMDEMSDVFVGMGWEVAEGPELEHEWYNFDALNVDPDHPARSESDTFYVAPADRHMVLRTQTSPVQARSLLTRELPVYIVAPGRVYRTDDIDATHLPVFTQMEGLAVDKGITMANLRGTLEHLARIMFGDEARIRLRPNYFPFTEPSAEMDVWHPGMRGGPRWVEWGGCGMVNPNVLRAAGVDPEVYSGFAFGMGVERTLQFRYQLDDMRDMIEGDVRFTEQFGMVI